MAGIWGIKGMKDNNTVQRDERSLEHGFKKSLKLPIFLTQLPNENKGILRPAGPRCLNSMLFGSKVTCSSLRALQEAIVVAV